MARKSKREIDEVIKRWHSQLKENPNLTKKEFAKSNKIARATLYKWLSDYEERLEKGLTVDESAVQILLRIFLLCIEVTHFSGVYTIAEKLELYSRIEALMNEVAERYNPNTAEAFKQKLIKLVGLEAK